MVIDSLFSLSMGNGKYKMARLPEDLTGRKFGKLTALRLSETKYRWGTLWVCKCDCGKEKTTAAQLLKSGKSKSCGCLHRLVPGINYGELTVIRETSERNSDGGILWLCRCSCGKEVKVKSLRLTDVGKPNRYSNVTCGHRMYLTGDKNHNWGGYGEISGNLWCIIKGGLTRGNNRTLEFSITIQQAWELFLKQERKCALSGVEIKFSSRADNDMERTASLDRIDSSKGYTLDNIQWVHKDINQMKMDFLDQKFIDWTHIISDYQRSKGN